jgi:four helix bundle protein
MPKHTIADLSFNFALRIIGLYRFLEKNNEYVISKQLLKSGTSIGANVQEASAAYSKKDFALKMSIASKEARETKYWLSLLERSQIVKGDYSGYIKEIESIINMLTRIIKTAQANVLRA